MVTQQEYNRISRGIVAKAGRYGGTYAYKDIAFEFTSWVSPQFKLYLIKEFERLKKEEQALLGWSAKRELAKINYRIHTDAIKVNLIPPELTPQQTSIIYASEADVLNQKERLIKLNKIAIHQMSILEEQTTKVLK